MRRLFSHAAAFAAAAASSDNFYGILRDSSGAASVALYNASTGNVITSAPTSWNFAFPLVESTAVSRRQQVLSITFPTGTTTAALYEFNASDGSSGNGAADLALAALTTSSDWFFDLQYSEAQDTIYGIWVNGTYGRVLSEFPGLGQGSSGSGPQHVAHREIAPLPYYWYVNASTFDPANDVYYGLLNHFPGTPNATDAQKLAVGRFASQPGSVDFVDLTPAPGAPAGTLHFLAWSEPAGVLYGFAQMDAQTACFVTVDPATGQYESIFEVQPVVVGPMFASKTRKALYAWGNNADSGQRLFGVMDMTAADDDAQVFDILQVYQDTSVIASVARIDW